MRTMGLLVDFDYCSGCHSCELACQKEHGYEVGQFGMTVLQVGPWRIGDSKRFQYDYLPFPTKLCDLCASRTAAGKQPICVQHCPTNCMSYGPVEELSKELQSKPRQTLYVPR